jgi:hypothetical protein
VFQKRAVLTLHAYPLVWMAYFEYLQEHPDSVTVTELRRNHQSIPSSSGSDSSTARQTVVRGMGDDEDKDTELDADDWDILLGSGKQQVGRSWRAPSTRRRDAPSCSIKYCSDRIPTTSVNGCNAVKRRSQKRSKRPEPSTGC